jgi:adenylate cyclase
MATEPDLQHRLVAILCADAVGYSRLIALDEALTIRSVDQARAVFREATQAHGGRIVDTAGDSILAMFETATGAARAAMHARQRLNEMATGLPLETRLRYRIGIHLGDVVLREDGSIQGDGVNIAARLQAAADPGDIVASESIRLAVRGRVVARFEDMGSRSFKNIAEPIRTHRLVPEAASDAAPREAPAAAETEATPRLSIIVLPFANHTGDDAKAYIAEALTNCITIDLTRIRDLFVVPLATALTYRHTSLTARQIGSDAQVRFMLQGHVLASGDALRIAVQLTDAGDGRPLWNESFAGSIANLFEVYDQVTVCVGNCIGPQMVISAARDSERRAGSAEVADLLLRARALALAPQSPVRQAEIEALYRNALEREPGNLQAMTGLAEVLAVQADWIADQDEATERRLAEAHGLAVRVREADPGIVGAYFPLAICATHRGDLDEARRAWEAQLEHNPKDPRSYVNLAVFHLHSGKDPGRAIELLNRALKLYPKGSANAFAAMGEAHVAIGEMDTGIDWLLKAVDRNFHHPDIFAHLATAYASKGDSRRAALYRAKQAEQLNANSFHVQVGRTQ